MRLQPDALTRLDAYIASLPEPHPSRPEAIRVFLEESLATKGPLTGSAVTERSEAPAAKFAGILEPDGKRSPEVALNTMRRASAEAEMTGLKTRTPKVGPK